MKKEALLHFFKNLMILLLIVAVLDRVMGWGLEKLFYEQQHGDDAVTTYLLNEVKEDIIVLGASRASHHFNAEIIEKGTGMSCYNGGRDNMPVLYSAAVLPYIYQHDTPKIIFLELLPTEFWTTPVVYEKLATVLLPFSHRYKDLMKTVALKSASEPWKARISHMYPFNSTIGTSFQNAYTHLGHISIKGYEPLYGAIDPNTYKDPVWGNFTEGTKSLDSNCINALQYIIDFTKKHNTRLIGIVSPFYFSIDFYNNNSFISIKNIMAKNNCELYDFSHDERFLMQPQLFNDDVHLNDKGASVLDTSIISIVKHPVN